MTARLKPCPFKASWLKDKFGLAWQIVPTAFWRLVNDPDPAKPSRVMKALMKMIKIDIKKLEEAYAGRE